jgi:hypothetical protein
MLFLSLLCHNFLCYNSDLHYYYYDYYMQGNARHRRLEDKASDTWSQFIAGNGVECTESRVVVAVARGQFGNPEKGERPLLKAGT